MDVYIFFFLLVCLCITSYRVGLSLLFKLTGRKKTGGGREEIDGGGRRMSMQLWLGAIVLSIIPLSLLKLVTHQTKEKKSETHQIRDNVI